MKPGVGVRVGPVRRQARGGAAHDWNSVHHRREGPQDRSDNRPQEAQGTVGGYRGCASLAVAAERKTYPVQQSEGRPDREREVAWLATTSDSRQARRKNWWK